MQKTLVANITKSIQFMLRTDSMEGQHSCHSCLWWLHGGVDSTLSKCVIWNCNGQNSSFSNCCMKRSHNVPCL